MCCVLAFLNHKVCLRSITDCTTVCVLDYMCGGCTLYQPLALYAPRGGGGIISATLWHSLLIIGGFKATGRARRVSGHCSHRRRLSVLVAVWHRHTGLGPPTVSSTDAVSGLRIRYFTLQLLLLLLLRLPLQVSLERNYSYYYSVPPLAPSHVRDWACIPTLQILVGKEIPTFVSSSSSYLPTAASPRRPARPYTLSLSMRYTCCSARE